MQHDEEQELGISRAEAEQLLGWFNPYAANDDEARAADWALSERLQRFVDDQS